MLDSYPIGRRVGGAFGFAIARDGGTHRLPTPVPSRLLGIAVAVACALSLAGVESAAASCPGSSVSSCSVTAAYGNSSPLGDQGQDILRQPQAVDESAGTTMVGDRWSWHVQKFDPSHNWVSQWGEYGSGAGQFSDIGGVAHDSSGAVYVLDISNNRVEKFDPAGNFVASWDGRGTSGAGPAGFNISFKGDLAVDGSSFVYVADTYNHRVVKFDTAGNYLGQVGQTGVSGSDNSHFAYPEGLGVDAAGNLYVADDQNDRIQKFDSTGAYRATIGSSAQLNHPYDVGVDGSGNLYVADNLNHRVDKFSAAGAYLGSWGGKGTAAGQLQTPRSLAVDAAGNQYVADTNNERMQEFDSTGHVVAASGTNPWGLNGRDGGRLSGPEGIDVPAGKLVIADTLEYWIQELDASNGSFLSKFGGHGTGAGQFELPADVAVDGSGTIAVADTGNDRIQQFNSSGSYLRQSGGLASPRGVAVDGSGNYYVADGGHNRVEKFSPTGTLLATWSGFGAGDSFNDPGDVAVSGGGDVYVADTGNNRVVDLSANGSLVRTWGGPGTDAGHPGPASLAGPTGIEVDSAGSVYVADPGDAQVLKYGGSGGFLLSFGARGHGLGEFWTNGPDDVTSDSAGNVYASDTYDNRVEVFAGVGSTVTPPPGAIAGRVTDSRTKAGIQGALVDCGAGRSSSTDSTGSYRIANVPAGSYPCTASAANYRSKSQTVAVTASNTTTANFALRKR